MGTRAYVQHIAEIVDPDRKIFGDRILSRDESGSLVAKNLQRLFPVDTKMVVIIDDRGDVWKWNDNLVKVTPYDFFIGIGDINSSFLPSKQGMKATPKPMASKHHTEGATVKEPETRPNGEVLDTSGAVENRIELSADGQISALEQLVSMGGGDDPVVLEAQTIKQDELIAAQLSDRPLLQKQKRLEEEEAASEALAKTGGDIAMETEKPRHNLLQDLDNELFYLERSLRIVHAEFFDTYAKKLAATHGGRIAELRGGSSGNRRPAASVNLDLEMIPDVKSIMPSIKMRVLDGVVIVFSGVVPLGIDVQSSDVALWAKSFGAKVSDKVTKRTTHLIAARNRTQKVRQAAMWGQNKIKIVGTQWLMDSIVRWEKLDEEPYKMKTDEGEAGKHVPGEEDEILSDSESAASALDTDNESEGGSKSKSNLRLTIKVNAASEVADEEDLEDVMPGEMMEDAQSPMGGSKVDWDHMKEELDEWIGDSGDDDSEDGESLVSGEGEQNSEPVRKAKRSYEEMGGYGDKDESPDRKKLALQKGISQSQESADNLGLPTPDVTVEEGEDGAEETGGDADSDDGWGDLEGDLAQEMQRAVDENDRERGED
jgi:RNA polymerase II subunit A-like phosphatase